MRTMILAMLIAANAHAETTYFVDGKRVENEGAAVRAYMSNPKAKVIKVQASTVELNEKTMKMKKADDISLDALKQIIK